MPTLLPGAIAARAQTPAPLTTHIFSVPSLRARAQTPAPLVSIGRANRPSNPLLTSTFIAGDWLIQAPSIGLKLSFDFQEPDNSWEHRILDISPIEMSVAPGGGMATVGNVTIKTAEDRTGQSILQLWQQYPAVNGVPVTIDFLVYGSSALASNISNPLRVFTGKIDTITLNNAITELLCVDDSIQQNLRIPQTLITSAAFPHAASAAYGQPEPLVYGAGSHIGAAPMLLVDIPTNTYLIAGHPMGLGSGNIAVYDQANTLFLRASGVTTFANEGSALITFGIFTPGALSWGSAVGVTNGQNAVDRISTTLAIVNTGTLDSNGLDGYGTLGVFETNPGTPNTDTFQITLANHRRSPGSDPTVTGTFYVQTVSPTTGNLLRTLLATSAYRHTTSAQTDVLTLSNARIAINETLEVKLIARNEGSTNTTSQTYEIGEVQVQGIVLFSAASAGLTTLTLPINTTEIRFNILSYAMSIDVGNTDPFVINPTYSIDFLSTPPAIIPTCNLDSNLDGVGQLTVITPVTSNQIGNNTLSIDFTNHRRSLASTETVTGTFFVQTVNPATTTILRDNLFVSPPYRQALNPLSTSFTATAINLGANEQLAVRILARNEGGIGSYTSAITGSMTTVMSTMSFTLAVGTLGSAAGQFSNPAYLAIDSGSNVWVTDINNNRVQQFSPAGTPLLQFGTAGAGTGQFLGPIGIALDSGNQVFVVDNGNARVQVFTSGGTYVTQFGVFGTGAGQLQFPWGIAAAPDGSVWVTDVANNTVQQFTSTGTYLNGFGSLGSGDAQFQNAAGIAIDSTGVLYVTDTGNARVQVLSPGLIGFPPTLLLQFGTQGTTQGLFTSPVGVAVGLSNTVWVTDQVNNNAQRFTSAGSYLLTVGTGGAGNGQFNGPFGIVTGASNLLWVADGNNNRLQQFTLSTTSTVVLTSGANDAYEIGEIGIRSFYQPAGGNMPVFLYGDDWYGRYDNTGIILSYAGLPSGTFFHTPDQVIASILVQEMGRNVTTSAFANAYTYYANLGFSGFVLDGGIGAGWAVNRDTARKVLGDAALQATAILAPNFDNSFRLVPFRVDTPIHLAFGVSNILLAEGEEKKTTGPRNDTMQITLGNLQLVHNSFEIHYAYNAGSRSYGKIMTADKSGSTLVTDAQYKSVIESLCVQSFNRFGDLPPLVIDAYWLADDFSAQYLLAILVQYFSGQRTFVEFDTTLYAASLQLGDFITVDHPLLPVTDNGGTFEVHTIRYLPLQGRMHLVASKVATLTTAVRPTIRARAQVPAPIIRMTAPAAGTWAEGWEYSDWNAAAIVTTTTWTSA